MRNTCSKLFEFFSKQFQVRSTFGLTPSPIETPSPTLQLYQVPSRRRRKNSPEPRMLSGTNTVEPVLVEIANLDLTGIHQRAQFQDPNQVVWDLCWDSQRETVVILGGRTGPHRVVDCEGTNKQGWQLTLRDVMRLLGYDLATFRLTNVWADDGVDEQDLCNSTIENLTLCQFEVM
jgi:hypothetical protein